MPRVKYISETQKAIIHVLWGADNAQNELDVQGRYSQAVMLKITRWPSSKRYNSNSNPKTTARD